MFAPPAGTSPGRALPPLSKDEPPRSTAPMKLGLGTVAFGMPYGVSNTNGQPSHDEVRRILELAGARGVRCLDTAALYGTSEHVLGQTLPPRHGFDIVTKLPRGVTAATLDGAFATSLENLRQARVYGLMLHDPADLDARVAQRLVALKHAGAVQRVGVSIYTTDQVDRALRFEGLDLVQVPLNLLDQRLVASGHLARLTAAGYEIHARSVFLQGLLLMPLDAIPAGLSSVREHLGRLRAGAAAAGVGMLTAALGFVHGLAEVDRVLVGVTTVAELREIFDALDALPRASGALRALFPSAAWADEKVLNPALWERR